MGAATFEDLEVDFTDIQPNKGFRYLLVIICTYSGWVKVFPTRTERSREVAKALLWEIVPLFGLPVTTHSDNGPAFVADVTQTLTKSLNIPWKLHAAYRPQSSGKVERMNRTLKETLAKLHQETNLPWPDLPPLALLRVRCMPGALRFSPFELLYW